MAAYDQDITAAAEGNKTFSGDTFGLKFTVRDKADDSGNTIDISGYSATFRVEDLSENKVLEKTKSEGGIVFTDATNGKLRVDIDKADLAPDAGRLLWELELTSSGGDVKTAANGVWPLTEDLIV